MTKHTIKIVIDTNIWLSYLLGGLSFQYLQKILSDKNIIILITGDNDILEVGKFYKTQTISLKHFSQ